MGFWSSLAQGLGKPAQKNTAHWNGENGDTNPWRLWVSSPPTFSHQSPTSTAVYSSEHSSQDSSSSSWDFQSLSEALRQRMTRKGYEFLFVSTLHEFKHTVLVIYWATHEKNKLKFLSEQSKFCSNSIEPILARGDFNIIIYAKKRNKNNGVHRYSGMFTLIHFHETDGLFTRSNNQDFPTLEKLDRILVSEEWEDNFPYAIAKRLPREVSDHNPLIIFSGKSVKHIHFIFY